MFRFIKLTTLIYLQDCVSFDHKDRNQSSPFIYPTNAQLDFSKGMLKFTLIFTLKLLLPVSV